MFAYCLNNPVNSADPEGTLTSRQIHDFALQGFAMQGDTLSTNKTCIYYNGLDWTGGWGFCDLYDTATGEVWELKRNSLAATCSSAYAINQLNKYVSGKLKHNMGLSLRIGDSQRFKSGSVDVTDWNGTYHITFWQANDGILRYDYVLEKSSQRKGVEAAGAAAGLVATIIVGAFVIAETGGVATPEVEQHLIQFIEIIEAAA